MAKVTERHARSSIVAECPGEERTAADPERARPAEATEPPNLVHTVDSEMTASRTRPEADRNFSLAPGYLRR
ncbi:MAG TPA: hypothetical protein VGO40_00480 [Longimicrobium sp.]|jgi:hypothetical protein|nr:hypothetical protein [Longimicrobium sp.]